MPDSNHTSGTALVAVITTFTGLACFVTGLRLYTRLVVVKNPGLDDAFNLLAAICSIAVTVTMCQQVRHGVGLHWSGLSDWDKMMMTKWFWASVWIYYGALCLVKVSILLQYLRVFPSPKFRRVAWALMVVVVGYSLGTMFSAMFICTPIRRFWNPVVEGSCVNETAVWFTNTVFNIITDIATTVLPLPVLRTLQLPKRQRVLLMVVFGLGFSTCLVSILRLHSLYVVSRTTDLSWDNPLPAIYSSTELNVGIICSCLPTLKGLISRIWPRLLSTGHSGSRSNQHGESHDLRHTNSQSRRLEQRQWEAELTKHDHARRAYYHRGATAQQKQQSAVTESESDSSILVTNRIQVDTASQKDGVELEEWECAATHAGVRGVGGEEDVRFVRRDPRYGV